MVSTVFSRIVALELVVVSASLASAGERSYTFYGVSFPFCQSDPSTQATDVNDAGVVIGHFLVEDCVHIHGFIWVNGVMTDLDDTYEEGLFRAVKGISQTQVILGSGDPDEVLALRLREGIAFALPTPPACETQSNVRGINDVGTMAVGSCDTNGSAVFAPAVYWIDDGTALALPLLPGLPDDADGEAQGVNNDGVVIATISGEARSYTWIDGEISEIPNLLGGTGVTGLAINNHNLIVGEASVEDGTFPAMSYDLNSGEMTVLGDGRADAVNDRGWAVGRDILDLSAVHAILYEDDETIDLARFFPPGLADAARARAINNYGWIVGWAEHALNGSQYGWLLVPIYDKGDFDGDGDVDHQDFQNFQRCFAAEPYIDGTLHVGCSVFDFDDDVDLDLADYAAFQSAFTGPTAPNNNPNGPG